jgi:hypothetical protein
MGKTRWRLRPQAPPGRRLWISVTLRIKLFW